MNFRAVICGLFLLSFLSVPTEARPRSYTVTLEGLSLDSLYIIVGRVKEVSRKKEATVLVEKMIKGPVKGEVIIDVRILSKGDTSRAIKDETVLLFTTRGYKKNVERIKFDGRGRMPITTFNGKKYAKYSSRIIMPKQVETVRKGKAGRKYTGLANLDDLIICIKNAIRGNPCRDTEVEAEGPSKEFDTLIEKLNRPN